MRNNPLENNKLKELFERRRQLAREQLDISLEFDKELYEHYDFAFNDTDDDDMIDTLDYGTSYISFENFIERMEHYKNSDDPYVCTHGGTK
jgi:hypothetical protein